MTVCSEPGLFFPTTVACNDLIAEGYMVEEYFPLENYDHTEGSPTRKIFDNIAKAFGSLYTVMVIMMVPVFSYYIPSFDPLWLRIFPSYPLLQGFKEIMLNGDAGYVLTYSLVFLVAGFILFILASIRFRKSLTV